MDIEKGINDMYHIITQTDRNWYFNMKSHCEAPDIETEVEAPTELGALAKIREWQPEFYKWDDSALLKCISEIE